MRKRRTRRRKLNKGGYASGPSHQQGGIPGIIKSTGRPIEFEGGEYIIRKSSVDKYGAGAMARINQGLANVSAVQSLKRGGLVRSKKYKKGGKTRRKRFQRGGRMHQHPYSQAVQQHWSTHPGGTTNAPTGYTHTHEGNTHPHSFSQNVQEHWGMYPGGRGRGTAGYSHSHKRGGRIRQKQRRMQMGGRTDCPPGKYRRGGRCVSQRSYRKGGTVNRARKMQSGGIASATNMNYSQLSKKA